MNEEVEAENNHTSFPKASFWALLVVLLGAYVFLQVMPLLGQKEDGSFKSSQNDFKHIWLGSVLMSEGQSPYDQELMLTMAGAESQNDHRFRSILPYVYLPFTGIVMMPLTWLKFHQAATIFQIINHLCLIGGLFLLAHAESRKWSWKTLLIIFLPIIFNWCVFRSNNAGQLNAVLFFGACLLYWMLGRGFKAHWLGLVAAFLMLFKITPGIFLIWFLVTRRFREAAWMMGLAVGLTVICVLIVGFQTHLDFLPVLSNMGYGKSTWADLGHTFWRDPYNQSINSFFHHIMVPWEGFDPWIQSSGSLANGVSYVFGFLILGVFLFLGYKSAAIDGIGDNGTGSRFSEMDRITFGLAILTSLLVPSIMWDHYLLQALIPAFIFWQIASRASAADDHDHRFFRYFQKTALTSIVFFWVITSVGFFHDQAVVHLSTVGNTFQLPVFVSLPGSNSGLLYIWMSLKLWPTLLLGLIGIFCCLNISRSRNP